MVLEWFTPIYKLSDSLNNNEIYIKRDDLLPFSFGGNKARKAALFFQDIAKQLADCVVTYGSSSSNHCRIIANICASRGLPCYIISPTTSSYRTKNSVFVELFGANIIYCSLSEVKETIEDKLNQLRMEGYNPYFIQGGGHGDLGTQAYVNAYKEIKDYEDDTGIHFDYIFHSSGTGTTQAGLICGKIITGDKREIVGISIARKRHYGDQVIIESVNSYLESIGHQAVNGNDVTFVDDFILNGYGSYNNEILMTIKSLLISDGIPLDKTYTGKAYWGMREYIKSNNICNKRILFIHTGGTPLFYDTLEELVNG